jgi:hypothetical protein
MRPLTGILIISLAAVAFWAGRLQFSVWELRDENDALRTEIRGFREIINVPKASPVKQST